MTDPTADDDRTEAVLEAEAPPAPLGDEPKMADAPNPWSVLSDHAKASITLSSALLAVSATFANNLLEDASSEWKIALVIAWLLLAASIGCGVYANATVFNNVKKDPPPQPGGWASFFLNAGFVTFGLGVILIGVTALFGIDSGDDKSTLEESVETARSAIVDTYDVEDDAVKVESYATTPANTAEVVMTVSGTNYTVVVDLDSSDVLSVQPS